MKSITKFVAAAAVMSGALLYGAEVIKFPAKDAFSKSLVMKGVTVTFNEDNILCSGKAMLTSKKAIDIDPAKKYTLKLTAIGNDKVPTTIYVGFAMRNAKDQATDAIHWQGFANTLTEVVAEAPKGAKAIKVKDGSKWRKFPHCVIMANAKADNSDVPNYNWVANNIVSAKQDGDVWTLELKAPLKRTLKAGTIIRQHYRGGYIYINSPKNIPANGKVEIKGTIGGIAKDIGSFSSLRWPINAKKARLIILADWRGNKGAVTIKDVSVTVE